MISSQRRCTLENRDGVGVVTLNGTLPTNTFDRQMLEELGRVVEAIQLNLSLYRGVVFCSGQRWFSAGVDLAAYRAMSTIECFQFVELGREIYRQIMNLSLPTIAWLGENQHAYGGGCELALACKRIISSGAMLCLPEVRLGIMPGWGGTRLAHLIGPKEALRVILSATKMSPSFLYEVGLVGSAISAPLEEIHVVLGSRLEEAQNHIYKRFAPLSNEEVVELTTQHKELPSTLVSCVVSAIQGLARVKTLDEALEVEMAEFDKVWHMAHEPQVDSPQVFAEKQDNVAA